MKKLIYDVGFKDIVKPISVSEILEKLEILNQLYENAAFSKGYMIDAICMRVNAFGGYQKPETEDGYKWFWGIVFWNLDSGRIFVLFPQPGDDRSIAIYMKKEHVNVARLERLLSELIAVFEKAGKV